ncbi:MerR family transcriptional regulator [Dactylosporangium matsuzakiense]|uniref:MerR family transcriptional regulator n=1 Tax=Dactylosporangium matsuzakiense TaxID=53360 RepID=A0A9W6KFA5_9ACTN|nr:MerR family transcriptional regulator [Dactylosporangium matsuzakiense]GLK99811.1 MerR family transcriptional regulator [Dactylosporangium matsuzakiense]
MTTGVSIGEFSRLCHLSAKTLRYYHDIGLLVPAAVDRGTGHRRYQPEQAGDAHLIRRLRGLDMPIAEIRTVLAAPAAPARVAALARHLDRMEAELTRAREVVASLRRLLDEPPPITVLYRAQAPVPVLRRHSRVARADVAEWCRVSFDELFGALAGAGTDPAGVPGSTYSPEFFERDEGEVVTFVPVLPGVLDADPRRAELPARRYAVAVHAGPFADCDLTYGALGAHVAAHDEALTEPIVEQYLVGPHHTADPDRYRTEVCWPVR